MRNAIIPDRWEKLLEMVERQGSAKVEDLAQALGISPTTVRRDLAAIQKRGLINRTRGGAAPSPHVRAGPTIAESRSINPAEKERIGKAAAALIGDGATLMFDGGFTTYQVARQIQARDLTVITNSLDIVQALLGSEGVTLVVIGGELSVVTGTNLGPLAEGQIQQLWANTAILGADAISPAEGLSSPIHTTAQTKKAMIAASKGLIVVADHTKLGKFAPYRVTGCDAVDILITDDKADPALLDEFRAVGIRVIVAEGRCEQ